MKDKEYSGNFYEADKVEELPDECPNCLYQKKDIQTGVEECPNCHYNPTKKSD